MALAQQFGVSAEDCGYSEPPQSHHSEVLLRSWQTQASDVTYMEGPAPVPVYTGALGQEEGSAPTTRRLSAELPPPQTESVFHFPPAGEQQQRHWASEPAQMEDLGGSGGSGSGGPLWSTVNLPRTGNGGNGGLAGALAGASRLDMHLLPAAGGFPGESPSITPGSGSLGVTPSLPTSAPRLEPTPPMSAMGSAHIMNYDPAALVQPVYTFAQAVPLEPVSSRISVRGNAPASSALAVSRAVSFAAVIEPARPPAALQLQGWSSSQPQQRRMIAEAPPAAAGWASQQKRSVARQLPPEDLETQNMEWALLCAREDQLTRRLGVLESLASCALKAEQEQGAKEVAVNSSTVSRDFNQNFLRFPLQGYYVDRQKIPNRENQLYHQRTAGEDHPHIYKMAGASRRGYFNTQWAIDQRAWRREHTFEEVSQDEYILY